LSDVFVREQLASPAVIIIGDVLLGLHKMATVGTPNTVLQA
jgi:hypothetical protein